MKSCIVRVTSLTNFPSFFPRSSAEGAAKSSHDPPRTALRAQEHLRHRNCRRLAVRREPSPGAPRARPQTQTWRQRGRTPRCVPSARGNWPEYCEGCRRGTREISSSRPGAVAPWQLYEVSRNGPRSMHHNRPWQLHPCEHTTMPPLSDDFEPRWLDRSGEEIDGPKGPQISLPNRSGAWPRPTPDCLYL
jgi:hypothetical protein